MRILYRQKCDHADLLPAVPSVTTLNFRRPPSVTTFNFSVTTLSCTPVRTTLNFWTTPSFLRTTPSCKPSDAHKLSDAPQKILLGDRGAQGAEISALF